MRVCLIPAVPYLSLVYVLALLLLHACMYVCVCVCVSSSPPAAVAAVSHDSLFLFVVVFGFFVYCSLPLVSLFFFACGSSVPRGSSHFFLRALPLLDKLFRLFFTALPCARRARALSACACVWERESAESLPPPQTVLILLLSISVFRLFGQYITLPSPPRTAL